MCAPGESTATIGAGAETEDQKKARLKARVANDSNGFGFSVAPPPDAPDVFDPAVQARKKAEEFQKMIGRGRKQSFMGADGLGDYSVGRKYAQMPSASQPMLGGGIDKSYLEGKK